MKGLRLYKKEKLRGEASVGALFGRRGGEVPEVHRAIAYPLRAVWRLNPDSVSDCPRFLAMVPKRRVRHAVGRVAIRRRIREAYRLNRSLIDPDMRLDIAFVWVGDATFSWPSIESAMQRLLRKISSATQSPAT